MEVIPTGRTDVDEADCLPPTRNPKPETRNPTLNPMKILDRYVLVTFLKNYLISLMVLIGLYVVLDMVFNFDELAEVQTRAGAGSVTSVLMILRSIGDYYFYQSFKIFVHLSG